MVELISFNSFFNRKTHAMILFNSFVQIYSKEWKKNLFSTDLKKAERKWNCVIIKREENERKSSNEEAIL